MQKRNSDSAVVMKNATLSWTKPDSQAEGAEQTSKEERMDASPTLRNISFTLPKVCFPWFRQSSLPESNRWSVHLLQGNLLGVCGNVGSGKTSLISSILEQVSSSFLHSQVHVVSAAHLSLFFTSNACRCIFQMHLLQGSISVDGKFAYVSQQAWIFHGTVQENILMGEAMDQTK